MRTITDDLNSIRAEQRGLKTNQPIAGSSLKTDFSQGKTTEFTIPAGGGVGSSVDGVLTVQLVNSENNPKLQDYPIVDWNVWATVTIKNPLVTIPIDFHNEFPQNGGTQFFWRPENITKGGLTTFRFLLTLSESDAEYGGTMQLSVESMGAATIGAISVDWTYHKA